MRTKIRYIYLELFGLFRNPKPGIHIINAHYVNSGISGIGDSEVFLRFLKQLEKKTKFITLQEATTLIVAKQFPADECYVAFTFDDGYEECYDIIAPFLEKHNCNAGFFINANYVESERGYRKLYHDRVNTFTKKPMNWNQIESLHHRGHIIGSHTLDHFNMAELSIEELHFQLGENKKILENRLNYHCEYFAWPYGQLQHFPVEALDVTEQYHPYIFSGTNYKHYFSIDDRIINRRHIEPFWPKSHTDFFLSVNKSI